MFSLRIVFSERYPLEPPEVRVAGAQGVWELEGGGSDHGDSCREQRSTMCGMKASAPLWAVGCITSSLPACSLTLSVCR